MGRANGKFVFTFETKRWNHQHLVIIPCIFPSYSFNCECKTKVTASFNITLTLEIENMRSFHFHSLPYDEAM